VIMLEPITLENIALFKKVRLRALQDTPNAFGSTYAKECQLSDVDWIKRAIRWNGETGIGFLALDGGVPCGIAGSVLDQADVTRAHLLSMWTAPAHRRRGIGSRLVNEIVGWARQRGVRVLQLMVTSHNEPAISLYEHLGFIRTGRTEPYPNDPSLIEYEMLRPVS
jgi:ribosomal protein S18 acetylase RimI-like enzyme